ncbi:hypothetical protein PsorP6_010819 [Peronosclerospora sorghi]|uniref:Uncharacterized protein n=1 Tax=Peronosclerospora sorghi TaxID=230839 RepID=A0ACC0VXA9_9STRA|nr:hypothetical protein PsorP6_010819 [Peronosclerospora sorghi]
MWNDAYSEDNLFERPLLVDPMICDGNIGVAGNLCPHVSSKRHPRGDFLQQILDCASHCGKHVEGNVAVGKPRPQGCRFDEELMQLQEMRIFIQAEGIPAMISSLRNSTLSTTIDSGPKGGLGPCGRF